MAVGKLVIDTEINNKGFDKKISNLEQKIKNKKLDIEVSAKNIDNVKNNLEELKRQYKEINKQLNENDEKIITFNREIQSLTKQHEIYKQKAISGLLEEDEYKKWDRLQTRLRDIQETFNKITSNSDKLGDSANNVVDKIEKAEISLQKAENTHQKNISTLKNYEAELEKEISNVNQEIKQTSTNTEKTGKSISKIIGKVGKWALAIFSVRSVYSAIRQTMSTLSQYNEDLANKLEAIKLIFASALEPIVTKIVDLVYSLLGVLNNVLNAWFGIDLFAKATALNLKKGAKSAGEIRKQLAGFDELNILNDNVGGAGGGSSSYIPTPEPFELDLSGIDITLGKLEGLFKNVFEKIKGNIKKVLLESGFSERFVKNWEVTFDGLQDIFIGGFKILGGIIETFIGLVTGDTELFQKGIERMLDGLKQLVIGAVELFLGNLAQVFQILNPLLGWVLGKIIDLLFKNDEYNKSVQDTIDWEKRLNDSRNNLITAEEKQIRTIEEAKRAEDELTEAKKNSKISLEELLQKVADSPDAIKKMTDEERNLYKAYLNNEQAQKDLKDSTDDLTKKQLENQLQTMLNAGEYSEYAQAVKEAKDKNIISAEEMDKYMTESMKHMEDQANNTFKKQLPNIINSSLDQKNYSSSAQKLTSFFSNLWSGIKSSFNKNLGNLSVKVSGTGGGGSGFATGGVVVPKNTYMASGGIVDVPKTGIAISNRVYAGEAGPEGVIPLSDPRALEMIANSIASKMNVTLDITNTIDGRVLDKRLKQINANNNFARNGE